jgi:hypothetical protein
MALAGCCSPGPFETVVARCIKERIVGGETSAVDASIIVADAQRRLGAAKVDDLDPTSNRAVAEYLSRPEACGDHDFDATTPARQGEVGAARRMIDRTADQFEVTPSGLAADTGTVRPRCWVAGRRSDSAHRDRIDPLCPFDRLAAMKYFP